MDTSRRMDEQARMHAVRRYALAEDLWDPGFDGIVGLAAQYLEVPAAVFSVIDGNRVWFKARKGVDLAEVSRDKSFCDVCAAQNQPLVIEDARLDRRFASNDLVTGEPYVRFYAGVPLRARTGHVVGALCVFDTRVRQLTEKEQGILKGLASEIEERLELRLQMIEQKNLFDERAALTNMIVHDATGILATLRWHFSLLEQDLGDGHQYLEHCEESVEHLQHMCNTIVNMHEGDSREILVECRPSNLRLWMEFLGRRLAMLAREARMTLLVESHLPDEAANTDIDLLERVVVNLTRNAIRTCDPGASILIEARLLDRARLELIVSDDGPRVPDVPEERLVHPYLTDMPDAEPGVSSELSFCRLAVRALNGTLECRAREPRGAEFVVEVPVD